MIIYIYIEDHYTVYIVLLERAFYDILFLKFFKKKS